MDNRQNDAEMPKSNSRPSTWRRRSIFVEKCLSQHGQKTGTTSPKCQKRRRHEEITLVYICRIRMRLYVIKSLNDIYMSNNF